LPFDNDSLDDDDPKKFIAKIGGDGVRELLKQIDVENVFWELKNRLKVETSQQKRKDLLKRLRVLEAFRPQEGKVENRPE